MGYIIFTNDYTYVKFSYSAARQSVEQGEIPYETVTVKPALLCGGISQVHAGEIRYLLFPGTMCGLLLQHIHLLRCMCFFDFYCTSKLHWNKTGRECEIGCPGDILKRAYGTTAVRQTFGIMPVLAEPLFV